MNLDKFFNRQYDEVNYNCMHFAAEIWKELTGKDFLNLINGIINKNLNKTNKYEFEHLTAPSSPCIVIMKRRGCTSHVGIYFDNRVIHLTELGVECYSLEIASRGFNKLRFIR